VCRQNKPTAYVRQVGVRMPVLSRITKLGNDNQQEPKRVVGWGARVVAAGFNDLGKPLNQVRRHNVREGVWCGWGVWGGGGVLPPGCGGGVWGVGGGKCVANRKVKCSSVQKQSPQYNVERPKNPKKKACKQNLCGKLVTQVWWGGGWGQVKCHALKAWAWFVGPV